MCTWGCEKLTKCCGDVCVHDQTYLLKVAVVESLPADMILGKDLPILPDLLHGTMNSDGHNAEVNLSCPVVTWAKANAGLQPLPDLHHSLIQGGTKGPRKSRRQRRAAKYLGNPDPEVNTKGLEMSNWQIPEDIGDLQKKDLSLQPSFVKAEWNSMSNVYKEQYVIDNRILYVQTDDVKRLVLPTCCYEHSTLCSMGRASRSPQDIHTYKCTLLLAHYVH